MEVEYPSDLKYRALWVIIGIIVVLLMGVAFAVVASSRVLSTVLIVAYFTLLPLVGALYYLFLLKKYGGR